MGTDEKRAERQGSMPRGISNNGDLGVAAAYCTHCGADLDGASAVPKRFGEFFCSDQHADAFVQEARAARMDRAATADQTTDAASGGALVSRGWDLKRALKLGACCGAPLLALVFLAGGGGALLGAGAAVLPLLALLACPLAMFFMMRAMQGHGRSDHHTGADRPSGSKDVKDE